MHELGDIIRRLYTEEKMSVLLVEQEASIARRVAERFFLMDRGSVVASGATRRTSATTLVRRHLTVCEPGGQAPARAPAVCCAPARPPRSGRVCEPRGRARAGAGAIAETAPNFAQPRRMPATPR